MSKSTSCAIRLRFRSSVKSSVGGALEEPRTSTVALRFAREPRGITFGAFIDGNRNGVRARDILAGLDRPVEAPVLLADIFPGVAIALSAGLGGDAALQLGGSDLLSFTPSGTATSGSVYIRGPDGSQFAVRVLGATGRARVLQYDDVARGRVRVRGSRTR